MRKLLTLLLAYAAATTAGAESCFPVATEGGEVRFEVKQDNAPFTGRFDRYGGEVCFAGDGVSGIDVWLEPGSVDTGLPEVDEAMRGELFFETDRYPRITFASHDIRPRDGAGAWTATGTVTVKGDEHPLEVAFTLSQSGPGGRVSGEIDLERLRYGVGTGEWSNTQWLGGTVTLRYDVPLGSDPDK